MPFQNQVQTEAKENALRAFYDEVVHIDPKRI